VGTLKCLACFTAQMPFLSPDQQCQSTEGIISSLFLLLPMSSLGPSEMASGQRWKLLPYCTCGIVWAQTGQSSLWRWIASFLCAYMFNCSWCLLFGCFTLCFVLDRILQHGVIWQQLT